FGVGLVAFRGLAYTGRTAHGCSLLARKRDRTLLFRTRSFACHKKSIGLDSTAHAHPGATAQYSDRAYLRLVVLDVRFRSGRFGALRRRHRVSRWGDHRVAIKA